MSALLRLTGALAIVGALAGFGMWLAGGDQAMPATTPVARTFQSSTECKDCHQDVWDEWHGSHHQIAFLNPEVRALSDDFRNKDCQACHLPRPVAVTGFGQRVLPRQTHPDEGVSCLSCHQDKDGSIMGTRDIPAAPCSPKAHREFPTVELCASCHNQHQTTDQWRASHYAAQAVSCNDCHMPHVDRKAADGSTRKGRHHGYPGAHDAAMLRKAGTFEASLEGRDVVLTLTNSGAGHNFPTEERHRAVDIVVRFVRADGTTTEWERLYRFRQPYRDEPGEDTQLPAGKSKTVRATAPPDAVAAEARLWYRLTPFVADDDPKSTLLEERRLELK